MTRSKVTIKHNKCNRVWDLVLNNFISNGHRCGECGFISRFDTLRKLDFDKFFKEHPEKCNLPSSVYLVEISNEKEKFLKIGRTDNFRKRCIRLTNGNRYKVTPIFFKEATLEEASVIEYHILELIYSTNIRYNPEEKVDGYTECCSTESKDFVLNELKSCFELLGIPL